MSKYKPLWEYIEKNCKNTVKMEFDEIEKLLGIPIDHSFLTYKKELADYGFRISKISMKEKYVIFDKLKD